MLYVFRSLSMLKSLPKHLYLLLYCLIGSFLFFNIVAPLPASAHALAAQVSFTGTTLGHPGTKIHITGTGFTPGSSVSLYTTASTDGTKCVNATNPVTAGLTPFSSSPTTTAQADGTLALDTTWPNSASIATTAYYICALSTTAKALSANAFTVAQPVTIDAVTPASVAPGGQVTITGSNWLPVQQLAVSVGMENSGTIAESNVMPDGTGHFSVTLTLSSTALPQTYPVRVTAVNEQTMMVVNNNALTVTQAATPTPSPTTAPSPTPSPTSVPTATATATPTPPASTGTTPTNTGGGGGNPLFTFLIFALGGLGTLLVIVGAIMFFVYSRAA
jgi:hypothetical protein